MDMNINIDETGTLSCNYTVSEDPDSKRFINKN